MNKLLVVIDYQKDFVDGSLGFDEAKILEGEIYNKVNEYLRNDHKVIFTYDTHLENYLETREGKNLPVAHCIEETEGHELYGDLKEFKNRENTFHIKKYGFGLSPQDMINIYNEIGEGINEIEIVGVVTNICVISNFVMFQSQFREANIKVDASLCASFDKELHDKAIDVIESLQGEVINRNL